MRRYKVGSLRLRRIYEEEDDIPKLNQQWETKNRYMKLCIQNSKMELGEQGGTWKMEDGVGNIGSNKTVVDFYLYLSYI